jgi:hypothetical protein
MVPIGAQRPAEIGLFTVVLDQSVGDGPLRGALLFGSGHQLADRALKLLDVVEPLPSSPLPHNPHA